MIISKDLFNSYIFELNMGNLQITEKELSEISNDEIVSIVSNSNFDHLTLHISSERKDLLNRLSRIGFYLGDVLVELELKNNSISPINSSNVCYREFNCNDVDDIKKIARESFIIDRYHTDKNLPSHLCDRYYAEWAHNSCNGFAEGIIVAEVNHKVCGFFTYKTYEDDQFGHLVLGALDKNYRGCGIFKGLIIEASKSMLCKHNTLMGIKVGTQINNISALRSYINAGFNIKESLYVLHYFQQ